ncbi:aquaporin-8-like isoform X3 [Crassostrea virginica]
MAERDLVMETEETGRFSIFESKIRPVLAEFVGSCILVFVVCLVPVTLYFPQSVPLVYGFAMVFLIESLGNISGGYFNPAITLGLVITQTIRVPLAVGYVVAQVLGGMLGAALARAVLPEKLYRSETFFGGCTVLRESSGAEPGWGVFSEAILTFILVLTVLTTVANDKHCQLAPLYIGSSVVVTSSAGLVFAAESKRIPICRATSQ